MPAHAEVHGRAPALAAHVVEDRTCRRRASRGPDRGTRRACSCRRTISPATTRGSPRMARTRVVLPTPFGPTTPMRSPDDTMRSNGAFSAAAPGAGASATPRSSRIVLPSRGAAAVTSSTSPGRPAVAGPCASRACARWMRAFCFVLRAFGPRESHSRSRRRRFWRFCSTRSSWARSSAFFSM